LIYFSINKTKKKKFIIGGGSIYNQFISQNLIWEYHITHINNNYQCDTFINIPSILNNSGVSVYLSPLATYKLYYAVNKEEVDFINIIKKILFTGANKESRTKSNTLSIFSTELRFNLNDNRIPMITTRPVSLRYIFEELMWILRGNTDNNILNKKKIHIWDANTSREFLNSRNLENLDVGDIGASYGFQMKHYGDEYKNCHTNYKGFNQLEYVIDLLKTDPSSRRIIINLWNPTQLDQMALPPCVYGYQFYVSNGYLSCKIIQRSSDIALAGSHNCVAGALLVRMLCIIVGLKPGELIWSPSDIHIYKNQITAVKEQIIRPPKPFPILNIIVNRKNILDFEFNDLQLLNYEPHKKIKFTMNA
jgi:thymidylate synthase